jgi:hypothetical protein
MSLTPFDKRLLADGLAFFGRPRLTTLLEQLGATYSERVDTLDTMLRHCSAEELDEIVDIFERAVARAARDEDPRRKRYSASAERRAQRRRA